MSTDKPFLSVVMPVYNSERYVADAIRSILAQRFSHFEFIIVDDGSTDGSPALVAEFARQDARIQPLFLPHRGVAAALNAGVALAQGHFIARMDADDIALPERFAVQLEWMDRTGVDVCGSSVQRFGVVNGILWFPESHRAICHELLFRAGLLHPTVLARSEILKAHPYPESKFEDYALWTRLAPEYRLGNVPQILLRYRSHGEQVSRTQNVHLGAELNRLRQPYFYRFFRESTPADYRALAAVAEKERFSSLPELALAGEWLVRLAQIDDNFLRQRMANRWRGACLRSAHLGPSCYRLYGQVAERFAVASVPSARPLWLLCTLRLSSKSRLFTALAALRQKNHSLGTA